MILTAHQPVYLPWLGLFHKIALADCFCIFDIAQYQKKDFNNRNKIKTANGSLLLEHCPTNEPQHVIMWVSVFTTSLDASPDLICHDLVCKIDPNTDPPQKNL